ncbi:MAG: FG-GAP-like repeat-containing protein [Solirubrobacterales bacterium]
MTNFAVGNFPYTAASADFNGDGKQDLVSANFNSNNVSVRLGDGIGGFGAAATFATGNGPYWVTPGDYNGDGKKDIATANLNAGTVSILLGNGAGGFGGPTNFAAGPVPIGMASSDFNGDGKTDLVAASNSNSITVLFGNGLGGFAPPVNYATATSIGYAVTTADFNGDGNQDIASANVISSGVSILLGDGAAGFSPATNIAFGTGLNAITAADFNSDGDPDLAVADTGSNVVRVLLGNGSGGFGVPVSFATGAGTNSITSADFNGDGDLDLVTANISSDTVSILLGNGAGSFAAASNFSFPGVPFHVTVADFNGDGAPDLATTVLGTNSIAVRLNTTLPPPAADLRVTKTLISPANPKTGEVAQFLIEVENLGPVLATNVILRDSLEPWLPHWSEPPVSCPSAPAPPNVNAIECNIGDLGPGDVFSMETSVWIETGGHDEMVNRATVSADQPDPDPDNNSIEVTTPITRSSDMEIFKSGPSYAEVGEEFSYTLRIHNKGLDEASDVIVSDPLPPGLIFVSSDNPDCDSAVTCNLGTIPADEWRYAVITVKAAPALAGTTVTNTAAVSANEYDPDHDNNVKHVDTAIGGGADLQIDKTASKPTLAPGELSSYRIFVRNLGPGIANDVVVTDVIPPGIIYHGFHSPDAPCSDSMGTVICEAGDMYPGQEFRILLRIEGGPLATPPDPDGDHLLDVQRVEAQIDLNAGEQRTVSINCPSGFFASDGSVRIDHIDQGAGDWPTPQVLESRASSLGTWQGTVKNTATGRAQAKIFAVCIRQSTVSGTHVHNLVASSPVAVSETLAAGPNQQILECGPGQVAIQPGFESSHPADLVYSQPEGNGWKFILENHVPADVTFSIRCMNRQVSIAGGHGHVLGLERIWHEFEVGPGKVNEAQLTCADGSKGIVGGWDLDHGLLSLGNDPRPVTRAYKLYNPTDHPLRAGLSLLCLGSAIGGEHAASGEIVNTAWVSSSIFDPLPDNNSSSASITVEDADIDTPVPDPPPVKPTPNNPIATTRLGAISLKKGSATATITCTAACSGKAKLLALKALKVKGKKIRKGALLATAAYRLDKAGSLKLVLKLNKKGRLVVSKGRRARLLLSNGSSKTVRPSGQS